MGFALNKFTKVVLRSTQAGRRLLLAGKLHGYLRETGWLESNEKGLPIDSEGSPLPWYTFSSIEFLKRRIKKDFRVFEYGSGNSTLWWAERSSFVVSCEHSDEWFNLFQDAVPDNVEYMHRALSGDYTSSVSSQQEAFDIIVIDGRERVECAKHAVNALTDRGLIVWDNSDREIYEEGFGFLRRQGFRRVDFWGLGPINGYSWCTSIFYKDGNCLGI